MWKNFQMKTGKLRVFISVNLISALTNKDDGQFPAKFVWDVVQRVIIIASVSEQVCTYPSPWPKKSQLITSACYCWARGRVGAQLRRSWHWSELFLLLFYFFFLQVIHGRFVAGFYFIMLSNWPVKFVPFQPFASLETEANSEFLTVIIILVRKASFY